MIVIMFSEGLNVHQVRFPDVKNIRDVIRVPRESLSDWSVKSMRVFLFKPRFQFARLGPRQRLSLTQKLTTGTERCLAARILVEIFYHVKPLVLVTWLASR